MKSSHQGLNTSNVQVWELQDKQVHFVAATLDVNSLSLIASNVYSLCSVSSKLRRYELCAKSTTILCLVKITAMTVGVTLV